MTETSKPMPAWFGPALAFTGLLSLFLLIKKAQDEGSLPRDKEDGPIP